jgi:hypothetical protein
VSIVDTCQIDGFAGARDRHAFIEQHPDSHVLKTRNHADRVVIAKDAVDRSPQAGA